MMHRACGEVVGKSEPPTNGGAVGDVVERLCPPISFRYSWKDMKARCKNENHEAFKNYGGRGITYDTAWEKLSGFRADMLESWFLGGTIDRINNDKGYYKENCRWVPKPEQTRTGRQRMRVDNKTGVVGVEQLKKNLWRVLVRIGDKRGAPKKVLYKGHSFEEACRIRKAWERIKGS